LPTERIAVVLDPMSLIMFGLIAVLIFFMFRNGKKRQRAMQELQSNLRPGAEVMLQSGIFATIEDIDDEENRVTVRSGTSTIVVHRNAIGQVVTPVDAPAEEDVELAPDDDPSFSQRLGDTSAEAPKNDIDAQPDADGDKPKA
jgi:preprotein translocase subunit YajC